MSYISYSTQPKVAMHYTLCTVAAGPKNMALALPM